MEDEAPLMQTNAQETQGVTLGKLKINIHKHDKVVERPQNTTNTILLDVTWASALTCWITCTYFGAVWGLSTESLLAWKQPSEKNNRDAGRELHVGECCWHFNTQTLNCKTMGSLQNRQNIIELSKSHVVHVTAGHIMREIGKYLIFPFDHHFTIIMNHNIFIINVVLFCRVLCCVCVRLCCGKGELSRSDELMPTHQTIFSVCCFYKMYCIWRPEIIKSVSMEIYWQKWEVDVRRNVTKKERVLCRIDWTA